VVTLGPTAQVTLIYINKYLKAKEELWNSNISPCKNMPNFKKSSYKNRPIIPRGQNPLSYYTL
jgi:hypothetical protein